jgi:hypothetical protein
MTEARFLAFVLSIAIGAGLFGPYGNKIALGMANAAAQAQKDQMSYGKFSRSLWAGYEPSAKHSKSRRQTIPE